MRNTPATKTHVAILRMIVQHDGAWGWYQLDRALSLDGMQAVHIPQCMQELQELGLVSGTGDFNLSSTKYFITEAGRKWLAANET